MSLYHTLSPYLFKLEAERAHNFAEWALRYIAPLPLIQDYLAKSFCIVDEALQVEVAGLRFYNPVGLSAGFDKNATMIKGLSTLGFGFLELGTITQAPQDGNPKPRVFRYVNEQSIQNAMGFNNQGSLQVARRLKSLSPYSIPLGINVGKNKFIAQSDSLKNYENVLLDCLDVGDYYVFNISSPNTPNLRDLQNVNFVSELFAMARSHTQKPLFLKIAPDMDTDEMLKVVESAIAHGASGVIATNTSIDYNLLDGARESGGISGLALKKRAREVFAIIGEAFYKKCILIAVGGIDSAQEAYERIKLGASLVQIFSSMIFQGPGICKHINEGLLECLHQDGFTHISEAVGVGIGEKNLSKTLKTVAKTEPKKRGRKPKAASLTQNTQSVSEVGKTRTKKVGRRESQNKMTKAKDVGVAELKNESGNKQDKE